MLQLEVRTHRSCEYPLLMKSGRVVAVGDGFSGVVGGWYGRWVVLWWVGGWYGRWVVLWWVGGSIVGGWWYGEWVIWWVGGGMVGG